MWRYSILLLLIIKEGRGYLSHFPLFKWCVISSTAVYFFCSFSGYVLHIKVIIFTTDFISTPNSHHICISLFNLIYWVYVTPIYSHQSSADNCRPLKLNLQWMYVLIFSTHLVHEREDSRKRWIQQVTWTLETFWLISAVHKVNSIFYYLNLLPASFDCVCVFITSVHYQRTRL